VVRLDRVIPPLLRCSFPLTYRLVPSSVCAQPGHCRIGSTSAISYFLPPPCLRKRHAESDRLLLAYTRDLENNAALRYSPLPFFFLLPLASSRSLSAPTLPRRHAMTQKCSVCLTRTTKRCSRCHTAYFCSTRCQAIRSFLFLPYPLDHSYRISLDSLALPRVAVYVSERLSHLSASFRR
jgi:endogenous inhibitor of DNA gyrase (YacG/DUF329 family)